MVVTFIDASGRRRRVRGSHQTWLSVAYTNLIVDLCNRFPTMSDTEPQDTAALDGYLPVPEDRQRAYRDAGYWTGTTFHDVVDRTAEATPDAMALLGPHRELTYDELAANSRAIAAFLIGELGLRPNERVVFQLPNCTEFVELLIGCSRAGVIPVMVLPRHREAEARHVVDTTDARAYVVDADRYDDPFDFVDLAETVAGDAPALDHLLATTGDGDAADGWTSVDAMRDSRWLDAHGARLDALEVDPATPGVFLLSGGTTGMPKAIPRTHEDYTFQWAKMAEVAGVDPDWVCFPSVPIGHNASLACIVGTALSTGATIAVDSKLKPEALMAFIERVEGNYSLPMPTQIIDMLEHPDADDYDLSSLEVLVSGGQKVPPRVVRESVDRWDVGFCNIFGMAEGPLICTRPADPLEIQATTVGRPIAPEADEYRVVDDDRATEVPTGEAGELAVRGPGFFTGYFRNPGENAENFDADGWFYTEDVVAERPDGNLEVYGRKKDTIIRGGENIYAPGVEDEIVEHPAIANAVLVGMPDDRLGERPAAFVELAPGADPVTLEALSAFLAERGLAVFKRPEYLEVVDELPRTEVGKIEKRALEARLTADE
jgi:non-ribosomal peptide synthetase component E (peptide arylation enzyme)